MEIPTCWKAQHVSQVTIYHFNIIPALSGVSYQSKGENGMRAKQAPEQWEMMLKAIERNNFQEAQMICRVFFGGKKKPKKEKLNER